jgi:hypothetical protein
MGHACVSVFTGLAAGRASLYGILGHANELRAASEQGVSIE